MITPVFVATTCTAENQVSGDLSPPRVRSLGAAQVHLQPIEAFPSPLAHAPGACPGAPGRRPRSTPVTPLPVLHLEMINAHSTSRTSRAARVPDAPAAARVFRRGENLNSDSDSDSSNVMRHRIVRGDALNRRLMF
jgi:hypothetical protein